MGQGGLYDSPAARRWNEARRRERQADLERRLLAGLGLLIVFVIGLQLGMKHERDIRPCAQVVQEP